MTLTIEIPGGVAVGYKPAAAGELEEPGAIPFADAPVGPAGWLALETSDDPATNAILATALEQAAEQIRAAGNPAPARPRGW